MALNQLSRQPVVVKNFFDAVSQAAANASPAGTARKKLTADAAKSVLDDATVETPKIVGKLLERFDEKVHAPLLDAVRQGCEHFEREHGFEADPGLIEQVVQNAVAQTMKLDDLGIRARLDGASNYHHDQLSLQPAQAIVSILQGFEETIPFAAYLPADVKSNEARLGIMQNQAKSKFGDYEVDASLDGINGGGAYLDSERMVTLTVNGGAGPFAATVTAKTSGAVAGDNPAMPLLRSRTVILVNGLPCAREAENVGGSGANPLAGSVTIAGTTYTLGGTVNDGTGAINVTTSAALPAGTVVKALAYIDFEKGPQYAPKIGTQVDIYKLFARASRGIVQVSIDAMTQMQQELSLDPRGQALLTLRRQYAQERHYRAIRKMLDIAANLVGTWVYDYTAQIAQKDRSQIWLNLMPILAGLSQQMANNTIDHGITTLYMTGELAAQVRGLPSTIFETSGIVDRPGIYRLGRLFGLYDVYYTPKDLLETGGGTTSQILCIGRATNTARNPIVLGDAVPAMILPLGLQSDLVQGDAFYTRNFTEINPHSPSANAAALINVTTIK